MYVRRRVALLSLLLFLFIPTVYVAAQDCFAYDEGGTRLTGTLSKKTFPGPPNCESIRKGDKPETYWILHLSKPVCTTASGDSDAESNITDLQLILTQKQYALYRKLIGRKTLVSITGKLSHAITGHHHTPVMMEVTDIKDK